MVKIRVRAVIGVMIFFGYFITYVIRYNLAVHIIDMAQLSKRGNVVKMSHPTPVRNRGSSVAIVDIISWNDMKVAKLFSAYHIGFCVCFPIFHSFGDRIGPTWVVGISAMISGVLSCLTPASAYYEFWTLFLVRMITGFCAGAMQPSMVQVLRQWVPPVERNHFMWAYCGITLGTCCTFLICAAVHYYAHWPAGFYICGSVQLLWSIIWVCIVTDSPRKHPYISKEELDYLVTAIGTIFTIKLTNSETPWLCLLKSVPFWALCILNFGYSWMIISLCLHGPLYYSQIVGYNIYQASALTALPFLLRFILGTATIQTFHWYKHSARFKKTKNIRKYFIVVSHILPGIVVASSWFCPKLVPGPIFLTIAVALTAAGMDLTLDLCYELTPTYVNSVHTIIKIIGNVAGIIVPLSVGHVSQTYKNSPLVWKHIWCFHAVVLLGSGVIFLICGETTIQPWNSRKIRPRRSRRYVIPKISTMSNITEVEEDGSIVRGSIIRKYN